MTRFPRRIYPTDRAECKHLRRSLLYPVVAVDRLPRSAKCKSGAYLRNSWVMTTINHSVWASRGPIVCAAPGRFRMKRLRTNVVTEKGLLNCLPAISPAPQADPASLRSVPLQQAGGIRRARAAGGTGLLPDR